MQERAGRRETARASVRLRLQRTQGRSRGTLNHFQLLSCGADGWDAAGMCVGLLREDFHRDVHAEKQAAHQHRPALHSFLL